MNSVDLGTYVGFFFTAWALGFAGGYVITKWKDAISQVS